MSYLKRSGERVSVYHSNEPIIVVAPHGPDDGGTTDVALKLAECIGANAVINNGFEKADAVDSLNDKADCNRINHASDKTIACEFYDPINKMVNNFRGKGQRVYLFHIHGFGLNVERVNQAKIDIILGYGLGPKGKNRLTCDVKRIFNFVGYYNQFKPFGGTVLGDAYVGKGGNNYAGYSTNNMNQLFIGHTHVESVQIEISQRIRSMGQGIVNLTDWVDFLGECVISYITLQDQSRYYNMFSLKEV